MRVINYDVMMDFVNCCYCDYCTCNY